jgi:hypothetical protein
MLNTLSLLVAEVAVPVVAVEVLAATSQTWAAHF